jgi:hypothetical protein
MRTILNEVRAILGERKASPLVKSLKKRDDVQDPEALAAAIGRARYGVKKFAKMAAAARKARRKSKRGKK